MIEELIYTSAPQGLKSGSKGFCTVASTAGMAANLASLLESLSGYRHLADPGSPDSKLNPVVYNHFKIRLGGRSLQILSRIADAGLDYSGRSNKLAHHVVLSSTALPKSGPAAIQNHINFHETSWNDKPHIIEHPSPIPSIASHATACSYWQEITGDAGWGGAFAARLYRTINNDNWIIHPLGVEPLRLIEESLALLPPDLRWQTTYTTFYTKLPPGIDCRVRCVVDGTPEAQQIRKRYELQVLDLCQKLAAPPESEFTTAGRTGVDPELSQKAAPHDSLPIQEEVEIADNQSYDLELSDLVISAPPPLPGQASYESQQKNLVGKRRGSEKHYLLIAGIAAVLFLFLTGAFAFFLINKDWLPSLLAQKDSQQHEESKQEKQTPTAEDTFTTKDTSKENGAGVTPAEERTEEKKGEGEAEHVNIIAEHPRESNQENVEKSIAADNNATPAANIEDNASQDSAITQNDNDSSSADEEIPEHANPFSESQYVLDKVVTGKAETISIALEDSQSLEIQFYYPKTREDSVLPYHLVHSESKWTLYPSDPSKPSNPVKYRGQKLMVITSDDGELSFEPDKRLKTEKHNRIVRNSKIVLRLASAETEEGFSCDVRFSELINAAPIRINNSSKNDSQVLDRLNNWKDQWQLDDISSYWNFFLRHNNNPDPVKFSTPHKNVSDYEKTFQIDQSEYIQVQLKIAMKLHELSTKNIINAELSWGLNAGRLKIYENDRDRYFDKTKKKFQMARNWRKFKNDYSIDLTWNKMSKIFTENDDKTLLNHFKKKDIAEARGKFNNIENMTDIPESFDPDTEIEFLKNIYTDLELGIQLTTYPSINDTGANQLILISTKDMD